MKYNIGDIVKSKFYGNCKILDYDPRYKCYTISCNIKGSEIIIHNIFERELNG